MLNLIWQKDTVFTMFCGHVYDIFEKLLNYILNKHTWDLLINFNCYITILFPDVYYTSRSYRSVVDVICKMFCCILQTKKKIIFTYQNLNIKTDRKYFFLCV